VEKALISLGPNELKELLKDNETRVSCQFCSSEYIFTQGDINAMILQASNA
jgi:redox-regulated HSP33 family molecular chaperone